MAILVKNPFNYDNPQKDPWSYGLVEEQIIHCIQCLFDNRSVLISGPRGIGKSSLGIQLQNLLEGDYTLLDRLAIKHPENNDFLCLLSVCSKEYTLPDIVNDIINSLSRKVEDAKINPRVKVKDAEFSINFGVLSTKINLEKKEERPNLGNLVSILVETLKTTSEYFGNIGINIMIDEVDRICEAIDFAHFIKIVREQLNYNYIENVSFIFAGQLGVYTRLIKEQPAFDRVVKHIVLNTLDRDNSAYIINAACERCKVKLKINDDALELIVSLSSGFPYILQLLGNESFSYLTSMLDDYPKGALRIEKEDVLHGIENIIHTKKERYYETIDSLSEIEQQLIYKISTKNSNGKIPIVYFQKWLFSCIRLLTSDGEDVDSVASKIINSLESKKILREIAYARNEKTYIFYDELLRIFVATGIIDSRYDKYRVSVRVVQKQIRELRENQICEYYSTKIDKRFFAPQQEKRGLNM